MAEFDMSLVQRGARNRRTPYYEATQKYSPQGFTVYNHMYFPIRFDTFETEFEALLNDVTIWDVAVERCLEISGPDGFRSPSSSRRATCPSARSARRKYVLICDTDGGIVNDPVLTRMDENTFWFALASSDALLFARGLKNAYPNLDVTHPRGRRRAAAGAGPQVQGPHGQRPGRRGHPRSQVLLLAPTPRSAASPSSSRGPAGPRRSATRSTRPTPTTGTERVRGPHGGRRAELRHQADRAVGHPSHRGRHLQLGRRHDVREQRLSRWASSGWSTSTSPTRRASRSRRCRRIEANGVARRIDRGRARRRAVPGAQQREVARPPSRRRRRSARSPRRSTRRAWQEHRVLLAAASRPLGRPYGATEWGPHGTVSRCRSSTRQADPGLLAGRLAVARLALGRSER